MNEFYRYAFEDGKPTKVKIWLSIVPCGRIYLPGQIHDPHIHVKQNEHVYCTGTPLEGSQTVNSARNEPEP